MSQDRDETPPPADPWEGWEYEADPDLFWVEMDTYPRRPNWRRIETVELPPEDQK